LTARLSLSASALLRSGAVLSAGSLGIVTILRACLLSAGSGCAAWIVLSLLGRERARRQSYGQHRHQGQSVLPVHNVSPFPRP
jgi:hypothetical protein